MCQVPLTLVKEHADASSNRLAAPNALEIDTSPTDRLDHNWGQRGAMEAHALVKKSGRVGSGAMGVARLRYFAAVLAILL